MANFGEQCIDFRNKYVHKRETIDINVPTTRQIIITQKMNFTLQRMITVLLQKYDS